MSVYIIKLVILQIRVVRNTMLNIVNKFIDAAVALAIKDKKHLFEISKMLGHTSIKTTFDAYGHLIT